MGDTTVIDEAARLHAVIRADSPELEDAINWLVMHGAPVPTVTQETVTYPGGSYVNVQVHFGTGEKVHISGAYLLVLNPSVALVELRRAGLAVGDPNKWEAYTPPAMRPPEQVSRPPVPPERQTSAPANDPGGVIGDPIPGRPGDFYPGSADEGDNARPYGTMYEVPGTGATFKKFERSNPFSSHYWRLQ